MRRRLHRFCQWDRFRERANLLRRGRRDDFRRFAYSFDRRDRRPRFALLAVRFARCVTFATVAAAPARATTTATAFAMRGGTRLLLRDRRRSRIGCARLLRLASLALQALLLLTLRLALRGTLCFALLVALRLVLHVAALAAPVASVIVALRLLLRSLALALTAALPVASRITPLFHALLAPIAAALPVASIAPVALKILTRRRLALSRRGRDDFVRRALEPAHNGREPVLVPLHLRRSLDRHRRRLCRSDPLYSGFWPRLASLFLLEHCEIFLFRALDHVE
jgi:hypothetical protein